MNNKFRYLLAGVLIFIIILLQPIYLKWLGYDSAEHASVVLEETSSNILFENLTPIDNDNVDVVLDNNIAETLITVVTPLYTATLSNRSGGTLQNYVLTEKLINNYKHHGGFDDEGVY